MRRHTGVPHFLLMSEVEEREERVEDQERSLNGIAVSKDLFGCLSECCRKGIRGIYTAQGEF